MKRLYVSHERIYEFTAPKNLLDKALKEVLKIKFYENQHNKISFNSKSKKSINSEKNLVKNHKFHDLHKWFARCVEEVAEDCKYQCNFKIIHSWANKSEKDQKHHEHNHPMAVISGVFYLTSASENGGGETYYVYEPTAWDKCFLKYIDKTYFYIKPEAGKLVLFPSMLNHGCMPNKDDSTRYTIAFDVFPDGKLAEITSIGIDLKIKVL